MKYSTANDYDPGGDMPADGDPLAQYLTYMGVWGSPFGAVVPLPKRSVNPRARGLDGQHGLFLGRHNVGRYSATGAAHSPLDRFAIVVQDHFIVLESANLRRIFRLPRAVG